MKKLVLFAILMAGIAIISCSKSNDVIIVPPPVELAPTVQLSVSSASILYSTDVTITWSTTNAKSVSINGESMTSVNGSKTYSSLITNTTFVALATNVIKTATDEKTVTVAEEPTPTAELTISPNDAVLPYGNDITVTWNITNFKTATLNGEAITTATGSKEVKKMLKDSVFTIVATNFTKSVTTTKTVVVGDWTSSVFGLLTHNGKHWVLNRYEFFYDGSVIGYIPLEDIEIGRYFIYYTNGTANQFDINNNILNDIVWVLETNDTKLHWYQTGIDYVWGIFNLTETELSLSQDVTIEGYPVNVVYTWVIQE